MSDKRPKYRLTLTETQALVLRDSLEMLARIHLTKLGTVADALQWEERFRGEVGIMLWRELKGQLEKLSPLASAMELDRYASYGIHSERVHDRARVAFDLFRVLRHRIYIDGEHHEPHGFRPVDGDTPSRTSAEEPLATIERVEEE